MTEQGLTNAITIKLEEKEEAIRLAEELNNSQEIDVHKWSEYPEVKKAVDYLFNEIKVIPDFKGKQNIWKRQLRVLMLDLYAKYLIDPKRYISYDRMKGRYKNGSRYNKLHISYKIISIVDALYSLGYIEHKMGHYDRAGQRSSHKSRMRSTQRLIDLITKSYNFSPKMIEKCPTTESVILREKNPKTGNQENIEYEDAEQTKRMRSDLCAYNNVLYNTYIGIPNFPAQGISSGSGKNLIKLDEREKFVRRIFCNGSWDEGGRYYGGWWQRIPKEWRKKILINGQPTIEIDYAGLHIVLLYAMEGINYWTDINKDPYHIEGYEETERMREFLKIVLLTSLNAPSKQVALKALRKKMNEDLSEYNWIDKESFDISKLIDCFSNTHQPISKYLNSGHGVHLQNIDSRIAERIINQLTIDNIAVLCIHDSFIIVESEKEKLYELMVTSFQEVNQLPDNYIPKVSYSEVAGAPSNTWDEEYARSLKEHHTTSDIVEFYKVY